MKVLINFFLLTSNDLKIIMSTQFHWLIKYFIRKFQINSCELIGDYTFVKESKFTINDVLC